MIFQLHSLKLKKTSLLFALLFALCFVLALLTGCVTPSNKNLVNTSSCVNGKPLQRTWITQVDSTTFELTGVVSDYFSFDFNHFGRGTTLAVPATFQGADVTYLVPLVFKTKGEFSEFIKLAKEKTVKVSAIKENNCLEAISWELVSDKPYEGALPDARLQNNFPWGGFLKRFPDAREGKEETTLEPFYSMSSEKKVGSTYIYTLCASVKAYGSPALACITVESNQKLSDYSEKNYYRFENIRLVPSDANSAAKKFVIEK